MITIKGVLGEGFDMIQAKRVVDAISIWEQVLNSPEFKDLVLKARFSQTNETSQKIFDTYTAVQDKTAKYEINRVPNGSETAATNTVTGVTTLQVIWINKASVYDLVNTIAHEYSHTPEGGGYVHSYLGWGPWRNRAWSVPYQLGDIVQRIAEEKKL